VEECVDSVSGPEVRQGIVVDSIQGAREECGQLGEMSGGWDSVGRCRSGEEVGGADVWQMVDAVAYNMRQCYCRRRRSAGEE
jgi:hypothetical protein